MDERMFGILNVNKPPQWTSRDVVNRVQWLVRTAHREQIDSGNKKERAAKVGHAGTLDPLATGVLVVCIGPATRLVEQVQQMPKRYLATFQLGVTSPSDDTELERTPVPSAPVPSREAIEQALPAFTGEIQQRPPAYSAIKLNGQKAYDLARSGVKVELAARPVTIHQIEIVRYSYPELVLAIRCGSGTYVRSLGRDLAESLGTGAVMSALERTSIGSYHLTDAISPIDLTFEQVQQSLRPAAEAVAEMPQIKLTAAEQAEISFGRTFTRTTIEGLTEVTPESEVAALDRSGNLYALLRPRGNDLWGPKRVFPRSD